MLFVLEEKLQCSAGSDQRGIEERSSHNDRSVQVNATGVQWRKRWCIKNQKRVVPRLAAGMEVVANSPRR